VLTGPPGSGTSTVARLVAERLGVGVRDTDADVADRAGASVADIFVEQGEAAFRALERDAVALALTEHPGVLAVGGGAVADPRTADLLAGHLVVVLRVGVADAARRLGFTGERPSALGPPRAQWMRLLQQRQGAYDRLATVTVDTDGRTQDEVASAVVEVLRVSEAAR
jgi:shikimate kinase